MPESGRSFDDTIFPCPRSWQPLRAAPSTTSDASLSRRRQVRGLNRDYPRLTSQRLPPDAPAPNPVEFLWNQAKFGRGASCFAARCCLCACHPRLVKRGLRSRFARGANSLGVSMTVWGNSDVVARVPFRPCRLVPPLDPPWVP